MELEYDVSSKDKELSSRLVFPMTFLKNSAGCIILHLQLCIKTKQSHNKTTNKQTKNVVGFALFERERERELELENFILQRL